MTCADLEILLCDYVDGTLGGEQKAAVEKHLAECATCAEMARDAAGAVAFMERVPAVEAPDDLVTRLLFQVPKAHPGLGRGWLLAHLTGWMHPVLQPRFAMGMAMTILSFSLLGKFAGIPDRPLRPSDLQPTMVWAAVDDRLHRTWDGVVKYYESLRLVYEIQSRLSEWTEEEQQEEPLPGLVSPGAAGSQEGPGGLGGSSDASERSEVK
jgi:hypothetical protein